ncbi:hypothetical protein EV130_111111 [Rhizobium azibense]|uniref:Uncharacterized protein n=1 Tax=Rhizobium azibense TaxID=1136135 RepID=A0A4R3QJI5_9HYPH|nr:hypothetical protein EV130_111111 [Rhizobium azibense]
MLSITHSQQRQDVVGGSFYNLDVVANSKVTTATVERMAIDDPHPRVADFLVDTRRYLSLNRTLLGALNGCIGAGEATPSPTCRVCIHIKKKCSLVRPLRVTSFNVTMLLIS